MIYGLGHVPDEFCDYGIGGNNLPIEDLATNSGENHFRDGFSNVNEFIGDIAKNYMKTTDGDDWTSDLLDHLNNRFPASIEAPKEFTNKTMIADVWQNLNQQATGDVNNNNNQMVSNGLCSSYPSSSHLLNNSMNMEYNCNNSASINIPNPEYYGGSPFKDYGQNLASRSISFDGMNLIYPLGVNPANLELITSPENVSSIAACSYGDKMLGTDAFGGPATLCFQQGQYEQVAYNMDFPTPLVDNVQSFYSNSSAQQNFQYNPKAAILPSKYNTQRSNCATLLQPRLQILGPPQPDQWPNQLPDSQLKDQSNFFSVNANKGCDETPEQRAYKIPRLGLEKQSPGQQYVAKRSASYTSPYRILSIYVAYKSMPENMRIAVSFQEYIHEEECKNNVCKCNLYLRLASHFDECNDPNCIICGSVRRPSGQESRKREYDLLQPTGTLSDVLPPKYLKSSTINEDQFSLNHQLLPVRLPPLEQWPKTTVVNKDAPGPELNRVIKEDTINDDFKKPHEFEKQELSQVGTKAMEPLLANCVFNSAPNVLDLELELMQSTTPGALNHGSVLEPEKSKTQTSSLDDKASGLGSGSGNVKESVQSTTPGALNHGSVLEPEKSKIQTSSLDDKASGSGSGNINIQRASLADFCTPSQIKEHLSSFIQHKEKPGNLSQNTCQFCSMDKLMLAPAPVYCSSCDLRIKRNVGYYRSENEDGTHHSFCIQCFKGSRGANILTRGVSISKANLQKAKNDEEREDSWVLCDKCQQWQHRICGLYNDEGDIEGKAEYVCPKCCLEEIENGKRVPLPLSDALGAKDLPRTKLSDHIEQRLFRCLKEEREEMAKMSGIELEKVPAAEGLVIRVVSSVDKQLEVKQQFRDILNGEDYPAQFAYRSKIIFLFQKIEGVDVCLFGICVQEFGSDCASPNHRCVYISYIDSVKYFRPERKSACGESLRTLVYHEILIGYLEYCKKGGFATCYIWACPLIKGEDYIFYCHPETQKTPKQEKLRHWYKLMLKKAAEGDVVVNHSNLYNEFFVPTRHRNTKITAARLPYFDGDYWSGAAENIIRKLEKEDSVGLRGKLPPKKILMAMGQENPDVAIKDVLVMKMLGQNIMPLKENFMIVRLQHVCTYCHEVILSGSRWFCKECNKIQLCSRCFDAGNLLSRSRTHTCHSGETNKLSEDVISNLPLNTKDEDGVLLNNFFENRDDFLNKCQKSLFQFDTLGHAKYSSMMILYNFMQNLLVRPSTKVIPETRSEQPQKQKGLTLKAMLDALMHTSKCKNMLCVYPNCQIIRKLVHHASICPTKARDGCTLCRKAWLILKEHAQICKDSDCKIPRCMDIKKHKAMHGSNKSLQ